MRKTKRFSGFLRFGNLFDSHDSSSCFPSTNRGKLGAASLEDALCGSSSLENQSPTLELAGDKSSRVSSFGNQSPKFLS